MWEKGNFSMATYVDLKSHKSLHSLLISEQLQFKMSDTLAFEFHYSCIHERAVVSNSVWRWQHRLEMEFNKTFIFLCKNQILTRNRLEIRRIEKNPKTLYRLRQRTAFIVPISDKGSLRAYSLHNEIFYDLSSRRLTQNRFSPCTLTFNLDLIELDLFLMLRYFLHENGWYQSFVVGTQIKF